MRYVRLVFVIRRSGSFVLGNVILFFFKQKTAYEMRISDWSSDVCSSDLMEDDADQQRMAGFLPVIAPLQGAFGIDQDIGDILHIADFMAAFAHFKIGRASCRASVCQYV